MWTRYYAIVFSVGLGSLLTNCGTRSAPVASDPNSAPLASNPNVGSGRPTGAPFGSEIVISRRQYVLSWNKDRRLINWAAWRLRDADMGDTDRGQGFTVDTAIQPGAAVTTHDFDSSCFDRGHQVPSADRTDSEVDNSATFVMSNVIPQTSYLNRGHWKALENHTRGLVRGTPNSLYVFAGPIFSASPGHIGQNDDIAVPVKNFKIIVRIKANGQPELVDAVVMPNTTSTGTDPVIDHAQACADQTGHGGPHGTWEQYRSTVAAIESQSGLQFSFLH